MMNKKLLMGILLGFFVSAGLSVHAQSGTTIQSCTSLLPEGRMLKLTIEGTVNTSAAELSDGSINLSTQNPDAEAMNDADVSAFIQCVMPLVR